MHKPLAAITLGWAQDTMTIMLWRHQLCSCPPVLPSPLGPHLLSVLLVVFILTAIVQMFLSWWDHKTQITVQRTLNWMTKFEQCSSMSSNKQRRHEIVWLKDTTPLLQSIHSISVIWSHYILMPSIANRQHQQNYFAKSFASHCQICTSYSVSMECCPANIEQQILNDYLQQSTCRLETIQLELL